LRQLYHGCEVQLFDGRPDRVRRPGRWLFLTQFRMQANELSGLAVGSPAQIAVQRVSQIEKRELAEAARCVEARGDFVGERLVMDEAAPVGRPDGLLVKVHGIERATFDAGDLRPDKRGAVGEIFGAVVSQCPEPRVKPKDVNSVLLLLFGGRRVVMGRQREGAVEEIFCFLHVRLRRPEELPCLRSSFDRGRPFVREETRLQLPDPVPTGGDFRLRACREIAFGFSLTEFRAGRERAEAVRPPSQSLYELARRADHASDEVEASLLYESCRVFALLVHTVQRIAREEKQSDDRAAGIRREGEVADLLSRLESKSEFAK
jgi:hypothetical protein